MNTALLMLTLAAPGQCYSGGCYTSSYYPTYYPTIQYVDRVVEKPVFVAVPTLVPTYSTGFIPALTPAVPAAGVAAAATTAAATAAAPAAAPARDDRVMALLEKMDRRLTALERAFDAPPPPPPDQPAAAPPPAPAAAQRQASGMATLQTCAQCHTEGRLAASTKFRMFKPDGKLALDVVGREKVRKSLRLGTMPLDPNTMKPVPLVNDQYADVLDALDAIKD